MSELADDGLRLVQTYFAEYGNWFVLVALFLENVLFLGTVIPGVVVLVMAGGLAQQQGQGFPYWLVLAGYIGTVAGDMFSYGVGRKTGDRLLRSKRWGGHLAAVSERVRREPTLLLFGHFASYLRMFVPLTAGISRVPFRRWLLLDATGAALWVTSHVAVGYFLSLSGALSSSKTIATVIVALVAGFIGLRYAVAALRRRRRAKSEEPLP